MMLNFWNLCPCYLPVFFSFLKDENDGPLLNPF